VTVAAVAARFPMTSRHARGRDAKISLWGAEMTDSAIVTDRGRRAISKTPQVAVGLIAGCALLLLLVPFGWRFGLWPFRLSFQMVTWAQDLALAAAIVLAGAQSKRHASGA